VVIDMGFRYECPVCGTEYGRHVYGQFTEEKICKDCLIKSVQENERTIITNYIQKFKEKMYEKYGDNIMPIWELINLIKIVRGEQK